MAVKVVEHPLVAHWLYVLRDRNTPPPQMRQAVDALVPLLLYEATRDLQLQTRAVETPLEATTGQRLAERVAFVPILRAGLGMVAPALRLLPEAAVYHLGMYRDEQTLEPVFYYDPFTGRPCHVDLAFILDPMLATGGSAMLAASRLKQWGVPKVRFIGLIAAPEGVDAMAKAHPDVDIFVAALDRQLNSRGYILPGLGDAGDRLFGTL